MIRSDDFYVRELAATQDWLVTAAQALGRGFSKYDIQQRLERGEWLALTRGVYLIDADLYADGLPDRVWWRAALLAHGPDSCLVGATAVRAFGIAGLLSEQREIEVGVAECASRYPRTTCTPAIGVIDGPRIIVRQLPVVRSDITTVNGLAVRSLMPSLIDAGLLADRPTALSILDSALHLGLTTQDDLHAAIRLAWHRRGCVALRDVLRFADGRAESPLESRVRLACIDGEVAPDDLQHEVFDEFDNLIAIGDLAWVKKRPRPLIGEADGATVHALPAPVYRDRWRGNALTARSCDTIRFTWADAMQPKRIVAAVKAALRAA